MIQCSSDPNSRLNRLRTYLHEANMNIGRANRGLMDKGAAMRERNLILSELRDLAYKMRGRQTKRLTPDFTTRALDVPCGVVIDYYSGNVDETEYTITTTKGHRMDWLDERVHADTEEDSMIAAEIQAYRGGEPW